MFDERSAPPDRSLRQLAAAVPLLVVALAGSGCGVRALHRSEVAPGSLATAPRTNVTLKAHLRDGSVLVFGSWTLEEQGRIVRGTGQRLDVHRQPGPIGAQSVALDSVALFESDEIHVPGAMAPITVMTGISVLLTAICATNPKACFGSCPTFHAWDGERQVLVAEGFSASVAPALEATDLDALDRVRARDGRLTLSLTNEALETHVVRSADLLIVPRAPGDRVVAAPGGVLWSTREWRTPDVALGREGDCRALLASRDARERTGLADSSDLAARETVELVFDRSPVGPCGLVITARQSLLSTFVFYQTLAWMGRSVGTWLASLEGMDTDQRTRLVGPARALGGIEVQVRESGKWVTVGEFHEDGPLASDTHLVTLPGSAPGPLHVRLRLTRGMWRVDQVALVAVRGQVKAVRVPPVRVTNHGREDAAALASLQDGARPLVTMPGDTLELSYELPDDDENVELFLESRGYYLEWMRDEWVAEENPARLARLFLDPPDALRELAPEFKRVESGMEAAFWGSRYAR